MQFPEETNQNTIKNHNYLLLFNSKVSKAIANREPWRNEAESAYLRKFCTQKNTFRANRIMSAYFVQFPRENKRHQPHN